METSLERAQTVSREYKVRNPLRNIRYIIMLHDDIEKGPKQGPLEGSVFSTD